MAGYREKYFKHNPGLNGYYRCNCCGGMFRKKDIDIDHIIPQNRGGTDELWNLQALCKHCNRQKQDSMSSTAPDLAVQVVKNLAQGNQINNVGGTLLNMAIKNFIK